VHVDLSDFDSTHRYLDDLQGRGVKLDVAVFNAGMMARESRPTKHGLDVMASVNFLAPFIQARHLLRIELDHLGTRARFGAFHSPRRRSAASGRFLGQGRRRRTRDLPGAGELEHGA